MTKHREKEIYRTTLVGTAVNALLIVVKFVAGFVGRSSAMLADAVHSLSDFITDIIVLVFVKIAGKPGDKGHAYGHGKFETLATLIIGLILGIAGIMLLVSGIGKVSDSMAGHELPRPGTAALVVAAVSIVAKEWLYRYTVARGRRLNSAAVKANAWHHRSDAISAVGTLAGIGGAIFLGERWRILDPLAAIVVSFFIVKSGYDIMKPCIAELLEASLPEEDEARITRTVMGIDGIKGVHHLRTRRIGNGIAIDLHAKMDGRLTLERAHAIATAAEKALLHQWGTNAIINIHMEPYTPAAGK